jgi:hypothetical protein
MSIKAVAWAFEQSLNGDAVAKLVLLAICDRYNDEHNKAWPNIEWISRAADCSARTVIRKIKKLETSGYLSVSRRANRVNEYEIKFERSVSDNLSRDTAVSPYSDTHMSPELYKQEPIKKRAKTKICDWSPSEADEAYARSMGHDPAAILEGIRLWDEQNGNVAAYHSPSAFYKRWCRQEKPPRATSVAMPAHKADKHENQAAYMLKPGKDGVRPFDKMTPTLQADMRNHNPVLDRLLRHVN